MAREKKEIIRFANTKIKNLQLNQVLICDLVLKDQDVR